MAMLDVTMAVLAIFVCFLVVPAFLLGLGFAAAIPLFGIGLLGQLWSKNGPRRRPTTPLPHNVEQIHDRQKRDTATDEEIWRYTG
jgi:hypothetical protein